MSFAVKIKKNNENWNIGETPDQILIIRKFRISNPEQLDRLLDKIPTGDEVPSIEYKYTTPSGKTNYVYCAHCKSPTHNKGVVLRFLNGDGILVGNECARKHYGIEFNKIDNEFKALENRAIAINLKRNLLISEQIFMESFKELQSHPSIRMFEKTKLDFNKVFSKVLSQIHISAVKAAGQLTIYEKVRDFEAEERQEERIEQLRAGLTTTRRQEMTANGALPRINSKPKKCFKEIPKVIGRISAPDFTLPSKLPTVKLADLHSRSKLFFDQLRSEEQTKKINVLLRNFEKIISAVEEQMTLLDSPRLFF